MVCGRTATSYGSSQLARRRLTALLKFHYRFTILLMNNIEAIIAKLERERSALDSAISALRSITEGSSQSGAATGQKRRGRPPKNPAAGAASATRKSGITEEGRRRLAESMKRRWAAKRVAEKRGKNR